MSPFYVQGSTSCCRAASLNCGPGSSSYSVTWEILEIQINGFPTDLLHQKLWEGAQQSGFLEDFQVILMPAEV